MAAPHAATSLSLTLGIAGVTLLAMGGILAGPTVVNCARQADFGACVHDRLSQTGLIAPEKLRLDKPVSVADTPVLPPPPAPDEKAQGWIDARAAEYSPRPPALVNFTAATGRLIAEGAMRAASDAPGGDARLVASLGDMAGMAAWGITSERGSVRLSLPAGSVAASGIAPSAPVSARVALVEPLGRLRAAGRVPLAAAEADAPVELRPAPGSMSVGGEMRVTPLSDSFVRLELRPRAGTLDAGGSESTTTGTAPDVVMLAPPASVDILTIGLPDVTGSVGTTHSGATASLQSDAQPLPYASSRPAAPRRAAPPRYAPAFPDVVVLPSPARGAESSFITLK